MHKIKLFVAFVTFVAFKNDSNSIPIMIKLNASNVAAFIGQHRYCSQTEAFDKVIIDMGLVKKVQVQAQTQAKIQRKVIAKAAQEFNKAVTSTDDDSLEKNTQLFERRVKEILSDSNMDSVLAEKLTESSVGMVYKDRGAKLEEDSTNKFEKTHMCRVSNRNSKCYTYYSKAFIITGKCDGLTDDAVIETKTRKTYWDQAPKYDLVQLQVYMKLTGRQKGYLNEQFANGTSRCTVIEDDNWQEIEAAIIAALPIFWEYVEKLKSM